ncbi:MAG: hypothetical protein WCJ25_00385 [Candidatus Moraniibacteriota bacterium]
MSVYVLGKRPNRDGTILQWKDVKNLGKNGKEYRVADAFLKKTPELAATLKYSERMKLGKELYEAGGGKLHSRTGDFFGLTEKDATGIIKKMEERGELTRSEAIRTEKSMLKTSKSTASFKRQQMREIYKAHRTGKYVTGSNSAKDRQVSSQASAPMKGLVPFSASPSVQNRQVAEQSFGKSYVSHHPNQSPQRQSGPKPISSSLPTTGTSMKPLSSGPKTGGFSSAPRLLK